VLKKTSERCYQKYYAEGRVVVEAETLPIFKMAVAEILQLPGILTIEPKLNYEKIINSLIAKGVPIEGARLITQSLQLIEHEAYFVPKTSHI
jgi:hypothetical protein